MRSVLIVEDDAVLRENIAEFLREEEFDVITAEDGLDGIMKAVKHFPDLIISDIKMPNMNGIDFFKTIQQMKTLTTTPFIFLTALTDKDDIRRGMRLGVDDYLTKPFDFKELLKVVNLRIEKFQKIVQYVDEKFYALLDDPTLGYFILDNGRFVLQNDTLATMLGLSSSQELKSCSLEDFIEEQSKENVLPEIENCLKNMDSYMLIQFDAFDMESKKLYLEMYAAPIEHNGHNCLIGSIKSIEDTVHNTDKSNNSPSNDINLTKRELEVLLLVCKGNSTPQIAKSLFVSNRTIDSHRANILSKTSCKNVAELISFANRNNLIPPETL